MKTYKNIEMEQLIESLKPHLQRRDVVGYAAARNTRILRNEMAEYLQRREELVEKYGNAKVDESGNPTGEIELRFDSPEFKEYCKEIEEYAKYEHEPQLYKIPADKCIGLLSGTEILEIDWMLEDFA